MRKYNIVCTIRKANPYRRKAKATQEHRVVENKLNREFQQDTAAKVMLTDITYLSYGEGRWAYSSPVKDAATKEILAYYLSENIQTFKDVQAVIDRYMDYYNNYRCQWGLKKLTPVQYRNQLLIA